MSSNKPSVTIGGHSKGDHPIIRNGLQQVRNILWKGEIKYIWVVPDDGISEKPILDIFPKDKLILLKDKWPSPKYRGIHMIAQAWQQIQENLDTDFYLFVDNDLIRMPSDLIYSLINAEIKWDIIGPLTIVSKTPRERLWKILRLYKKNFRVLLHKGQLLKFNTIAYAESQTADPYPFKIRDVYGRYLRMEGYCMCWLAYTSVFKSVKITNPDPYYTTFRKLDLLGYSIFMDPTIKCEHAPSQEHRLAGSPFSRTVQLKNLKELIELGYMTYEDLDYYYAWMNEANPLGEGTAKSDLTKYERGNKYWEKFRRFS
jgi:hypothetical protein